MKADVHPAKPSRLVIPSWVPNVIAQSVHASYTAEVDRLYRTALKESGYFEPEVPDDEDIDQLLRDDGFRAGITDLVSDDELANITGRYLPLVADHRMESVWRELSRHDSNGAPLHPAISANQDMALLELFETALECRQQHKNTTTQRHAEFERDHYLAKAVELRDDAIMVLTQSPRNKCLERYKKLQGAAQTYEDLAGEIYAANSAMALERSHDGQARWVALTIGNKFRELFRSPMYGLTATIASVVLGREIEPRMARQWLSYPAVKPLKIST